MASDTAFKPFRPLRMLAAVVLVALVLAATVVASLPASSGFANVVRPNRAASAADSARSITVFDPQPVRVEVLMVGDILLHDQINNSALQSDGSYDYTHVFAHVADQIEAADLAIVNQETIFGFPERGFDMGSGAGGPLFNSPTAVADAEVAVGFDVVLKAHNHVYDQGVAGLAHELDYWYSTYPQIPILGVTDPEDIDGEHDWVSNVYIWEKDGFKIAILNHTFGINEWIDSDLHWRLTSQLSDEKVAHDVVQARALGADMIVACPHWGIEYDTAPSNEELHYSSLMADLGVDVIFGCHPHIMQGVNVLEGKDGHKTVCFYSNGNFIASALPPTSMISGLSKVTLVKMPDGSCSIEQAQMIPTVVHRSYGVDMTSYLLSDYDDSLAATNQYSSLTHEFVDSFCTEVLGEGYDPTTSIYTLPSHYLL